MRRPIAELAARETALDRLLDIEARLEARLEAARREGEARVAAAEATVKDDHAALDAELEAARVASSLRLAADISDRVRALQAVRHAAIARLDRVGREQLEEMIAWLAAEVVADLGGGVRR